MKKKLDVAEVLPYLAKLKFEGKKDKECAKLLGISHATYQKYKKQNKDFKLAAEADEKGLDQRVEEALLALATGFSKKVKKIYKLKSSHYDENGKKVEEEHLEEREEEIFYPPNLSAQTFWLKSRHPERWTEKQDKDLPEEHQEGLGVVLMPEIMQKGGEDDG